MLLANDTDASSLMLYSIYLFLSYIFLGAFTIQYRHISNWKEDARRQKSQNRKWHCLKKERHTNFGQIY